MDEAKIRAVVDEQANDERLWFQPVHITEDTLQKELRRLHAVIEGKTPEECAVEVLTAHVCPRCGESNPERLQMDGCRDPDCPENQ